MIKVNLLNRKMDINKILRNLKKIGKFQKNNKKNMENSRIIIKNLKLNYNNMINYYNKVRITNKHKKRK